jgi:hypothetical protein
MEKHLRLARASIETRRKTFSRAIGIAADYRDLLSIQQFRWIAEIGEPEARSCSAGSMMCKQSISNL